MPVRSYLSFSATIYNLYLYSSADSCNDSCARAQGSDAPAAEGTTSILRLYRRPGLSDSKRATLLAKAQQSVSSSLTGIDAELCFNIALLAPLSAEERSVLLWLLRETFEPENTADSSFFEGDAAVVEVGPRMNFSTAWSANAVSIFHACGLAKVTRVECSRRFRLAAGAPLPPHALGSFAALVHDRMTECVYAEPLRSFASSKAPEAVYTIPLLEEGRPALEAINKRLGLGFDEQAWRPTPPPAPAAEPACAACHRPPPARLRAARPPAGRRRRRCRILRCT